MGKEYLVKCGWGDTVAKLKYVIGNIYHFQTKNGFIFTTNDLSDVIQISN